MRMVEHVHTEPRIRPCALTPPRLQPRFVSFIPCSTAALALLSSVASSPCPCQILRPFLRTKIDYVTLEGVARHVGPSQACLGEAATPHSCVDCWRWLAHAAHERKQVGRGTPFRSGRLALNASNEHLGGMREHTGAAACLIRTSGWRRVHARETRFVLPPNEVRRTPGISCEAPKFTRLRQLHPLVRRPRVTPSGRSTSPLCHSQSTTCCVSASNASTASTSKISRPPHTGFCFRFSGKKE